MTELIVLTLPYAAIFVGIMVITNLTLGKQEAQKAAILAAPQPDAQSLDDVQAYVFEQVSNTGNANIQIGFSEEEDYIPDQDYATEEPVLPYGEGGLDGENDLHAGLVLLSYRVEQSSSIQGGQVEVTETVHTTNEGRILEDNRIIDALEEDMAVLLNDWLTYSRANARFSYAYDEDQSSSSDLQGTFTLGREGVDGITYLSATRKLDMGGEPITRGEHHATGDISFGDASIDVEPFGQITSVPVNDSQGASLEPMFATAFPSPELNGALSMDEREEIWDSTFGQSTWNPGGVAVSDNPFGN
ncbi:MAG: hypothetical protein ACYTGH_01635 [Planctomycetota bacterium]|jgi:hypothetical protein